MIRRERRDGSGGRLWTVLGIDTATSFASVGVTRGGTVLAEHSELQPRGHAASLPQMVERVIGEAGLALKDLGGVAVSIGPGSFTGLRVGISFAKGLSFATGAPLAGVPTLAAFAEAADRPGGLVVTCLDARKEEVYVAVYERVGAEWGELLPPVALAPDVAVDTVAGVLAGRTGEIVGDAAERYASRFCRLVPKGLRLVPFRESHPRGGIVALRGERILSVAGEIPEVQPLYVRPSTAEVRLREGTLTMEKSL